MQWFQLILDPDQKTLTEEEMHELVMLYISRYDEEADQLRAKEMRPGRPVPRRLDELEMARRQEEQEYSSSGFNMPELRDARNVETLRAWNGDYNSLSTIKQTRLLAPKDI